MTDNVNTGDANDPNNYVSFDDYLAGAPKIWARETLIDNWNRAHPDAPVQPYGNANVPDLAPNYEAFTPDEGDTTTRVFAALQLVGGGIELFIAAGALLAPEPTGATKVVGVVLLLHSVDTLQASSRAILSGNRTATFTQLGATQAAYEVGASPTTAETIGVVTDIAVGAAGTFGVGTLSRTAPAAGSQLVHLTSSRAAVAIRAEQTLGLGKTVYAGPEALAKARGFSIVARTGIRAKDATEVILLPSAANDAFLVARPLGPLSLWQRVNGTVFSAGAGSFNLTTGVFTRTGAAVNQLAIYGLDSGLVSLMRVPAAVNASPSTSPR
jgi:hypothetical protein